MLGAAVAVVAMLTASISAMAGGEKAKFNLDGIIGYVGISQDPSNPTSVQAKFKFDKWGQPKKVEIDTSNEMVIGGLAGLRQCEDEACEALAIALSGAPITSLHDSTAILDVNSVEFVKYTLPTPIGDVPLFAQVISGDIEGKLKGTVQVSTPQELLYGTTDMSIQGTAAYACFSSFLSELGVPDALPGPLRPCVIGQGQLLPIELNVVDSGRIDIQKQLVSGPDGPEAVDSTIKIDGALTVSVETAIDLHLLVRGDVSAISTTAGLQITDAVGEVVLD